MIRGYEGRAFDPVAFHAIVRRELNESGYEPTNKVVRLIVLHALADSLADLGCDIVDPTWQVLRKFRWLIPAVLTDAIDDHFATSRVPL